MKLLYFAWVREMTGVAEEEVTPPDGIVTAGDLMAWLATRDEGYATAFAETLFMANDLLRDAFSYSDKGHALWGGRSPAPPSPSFAPRWS